MLYKKLFVPILFFSLLGSISHSMEEVENDQEVENSTNRGLKLDCSKTTTREDKPPRTKTRKKNTNATEENVIPPEPWLNQLDQHIDNGIAWVAAHKAKSAVGAVIGSLLLCKIFKKQLKQGVEKLKDYAQSKFIEALIKWEDIKEDGFTRSDYIKGFLALVMAGSMGGGIYYYGSENTLNLLKQCLSFIKIHKVAVGSYGLGVVLTYWLYTLKSSFDNKQSRILNFDTFLASLTEEQRIKIFNSPDLLVTVGKGSDNHLRLLQNEEFMSLLTETQKSYLQSIVRYRCSGVRE